MSIIVRYGAMYARSIRAPETSVMKVADEAKQGVAG